jgi:hypothetical protein
MSPKSVAKKTDYAPMVVFKLNTRPPKDENHLTIKKQYGFKKKPLNTFTTVQGIVSRGSEPVVLYVIEYKEKIIGAIAAPPNSCYTTDESAFGPASKSPTDLHLYNPCHRTQTGAWV